MRPALVQLVAGQQQRRLVAGCRVKPALAHAGQPLTVARRGRLLEHGLGLGAELQLIRLPAGGRQQADQPGGLAADRRLRRRSFVRGQEQVFGFAAGKRLEQGGRLAEPLAIAWRARENCRCTLCDAVGKTARRSPGRPPRRPPRRPFRQGSRPRGATDETRMKHGSECRPFFVFPVLSPCLIRGLFLLPSEELELLRLVGSSTVVRFRVGRLGLLLQTLLRVGQGLSSRSTACFRSALDWGEAFCNWSPLIQVVDLADGASGGPWVALQDLLIGDG